MAMIRSKRYTQTYKPTNKIRRGLVDFESHTMWNDNMPTPIRRNILECNIGIKSENEIWAAGYEANNLGDNPNDLRISSRKYPNHFIGGSGLRYSFYGIRIMLSSCAHSGKIGLKGASIRNQLKYLGLLNEFNTGITSCTLPYSFW